MIVTELSQLNQGPGAIDLANVWEQSDAFFRAAVAQNLAVALWRAPGQEPPRGLATLDSVGQPAQIDFCTREPAFVFAPFANGPHNAALRLGGDLVFTGAGVHLAPALNTSERRQGEAFVARWQQQMNGFAATTNRWYLPPVTNRPSHPVTQTEFTRLVREAVAFIQETRIAKVVVSRNAERALPPAFAPAGAFAELCVRYPQAFVSLVAIPGVGTWLGASPEVLLTVDNHSLTTMALAGTQRRPEDRPLQAVRWGHKETVEQEMVSAYIRDFFQQAGVKGLCERGPQTVAAGNVVHLQTLFQVDLPEVERLQLANRVLSELHPTSAVCGMPKHKALSFILAHENYDRSFYSGFLGPVHIDDRSSLYVNLRCMQLGAHSANLYVGAGVTADSDPEAEWRETEMKAETMLSVLGG